MAKPGSGEGNEMEDKGGVCGGYCCLRRDSKNTTASKKPPWFSSRNIGHLAIPSSPEVLSRVASAILGKRRAGTYLRRLLAAPVHQPQQFQQQVDS